MTEETKQRLARLTSNILNPCLLSVAILWLLSAVSTETLGEAVKWSLISLGLSIIPVFLTVIYLVHNGRLDGIFANIRQQRTKLYLLGGFCCILNGLILALLGAPLMLIMAFATALSIAIVFMFVNLWWKISMHTAVVAASATVLTMFYGWFGVGAATLVPLTAWARVELKNHSLAQAITGALVAPALVMLIFYRFGVA